VQLRLDDPVLVPELVAYLRRATCIAVDDGAGFVTVDIATARDTDDAARWLRLIVAGWEAVHPNVQIRLLC
jgi:hypothetical protein